MCSSSNLFMYLYAWSVVQVHYMVIRRVILHKTAVTKHIGLAVAPWSTCNAYIVYTIVLSVHLKTENVAVVKMSLHHRFTAKTLQRTL